MKEMQIFNNPSFGSVRTFTEPDGTVLFCASDVAKALGYRNAYDAVQRHCRAIVKRDTPISGKIQAVTYIADGDIYRLAAKSELPGADKFERWIFDEVLPSIRKTGSYSVESRMLPHDYYSALQALVQTEGMRLEAEEKALVLSEKIRKDEPYTLTGKTIETVQNAIKIEEFARFVQNTYKRLGRNKMFQLLRDKKVFYQNGGVTLPLQEYMNRGYFVVKESTYTQGGMTNTRPTILITGKGQVWLANKLNAWLASPSICEIGDTRKSRNGSANRIAGGMES